MYIASVLTDKANSIGRQAKQATASGLTTVKNRVEALAKQARAECDSLTSIVSQAAQRAQARRQKAAQQLEDDLRSLEGILRDAAANRRDAARIKDRIREIRDDDDYDVTKPSSEMKELTESQRQMQLQQKSADRAILDLFADTRQSADNGKSSATELTVPGGLADKHQGADLA